MINLIPPSAKARIRTEYWVRAASLWLFILASVAVIFAVALLPTQVLITTQSGYHLEQETTTTASSTGSVSAARLLSVANEEARLLVEMSRTHDLMPLVEIVNAAAKRDAVQVSGFEFSRAGDAMAPVRVSGVAPDRAALASFRDTLLADVHIEQVELPISNFAKNRDIEFSLMLEISTTTFRL